MVGAPGLAIDHQDRPLGAADYPLDRRADEDVAQQMAAMGTDHNEVHVGLPSELDDRAVSGTRHDLDRQVDIVRIVPFERCLEPGEAALQRLVAELQRVVGIDHVQHRQASCGAPGEVKAPLQCLSARSERSVATKRCCIRFLPIASSCRA